MIRRNDKIDNAEVVTVTKEELRSRIERIYENAGDPLPAKWVLDIELGDHNFEIKDAK